MTATQKTTWIIAGVLLVIVGLVIGIPIGAWLAVIGIMNLVGVQMIKRGAKSGL